MSGQYKGKEENRISGFARPAELIQCSAVRSRGDPSPVPSLPLSCHRISVVKPLTCEPHAPFYQHISCIALINRLRTCTTLPPLPNTWSMATCITGTKMAQHLDNVQCVAGGLVLGQREESGRSNSTLIRLLVQRRERRRSPPARYRSPQATPRCRHLLCPPLPHPHLWPWPIHLLQGPSPPYLINLSLLHPVRWLAPCL